MRKYQPIWEAIKFNPQIPVDLAACSTAHIRIIRAVKKEKNIDLGWKQLCLEEGVRYKLDYKIEGKLITFSLINTTPIRLIDL